MGYVPETGAQFSDVFNAFFFSPEPGVEQEQEQELGQEQEQEHSLPYQKIKAWHQKDFSTCLQQSKYSTVTLLLR